MKKTESIIPAERIQRCIFLIRKHKIMLDRDLAALYGVTTKALNQAVKRNISRFPPDFMFKLTKTEQNQLVTNCDRFEPLKHSSVSSYAFTQEGIAMLSSVLRSQRAVEVNIAIMRTFVKLREILSDNALLRRKVESMERKYDEQFKTVFQVLERMLAKPKKPKQPFGFHSKKTGKKGFVTKSRSY